MARKLIERYRRNEGIDLNHSLPVRLADGQDWYLPRPMLELRPRFNGGQAAGVNRFLTCGEELDELIEAIAQAQNPDLQILAVLRLGGDLLKRNYSDLSDEELQQLFRYRYGEPESDAMVKGIISVATGKLVDAVGWSAIEDPKAPAAGCA